MCGLFEDGLCVCRVEARCAQSEGLCVAPLEGAGGGWAELCVGTAAGHGVFDDGDSVLARTEEWCCHQVAGLRIGHRRERDPLDHRKQSAHSTQRGSTFAKV